MSYDLYGPPQTDEVVAGAVLLLLIVGFLVRNYWLEKM